MGRTDLGSSLGCSRNDAPQPSSKRPPCKGRRGRSSLPVLDSQQVSPAAALLAAVSMASNPSSNG